MSQFTNVKPTKAFPLVIAFEWQHPAIETKKLEAGFRDWEHWKAYAAQMYKRNGVKCRHPVEVARLQ
jgi:hypothetical protein